MKRLIVILALGVALLTAASASAVLPKYWWSLSQARAYYHNIALMYHGNPIVFTVAPKCVGVGKGYSQKIQGVTQLTWEKFTCHGPATSTSKTDPLVAPVTKQYRWILSIWPGKEGVTSNIQVVG